MTVRRPVFWILLFAVAMAWIEASVVLYLRTLVGMLEPYQSNPFPHVGTLGNVEIIREAATLVMLFAVGRLAGSTRWSRWAYSLLAFGIWDLCYYLFLIPLTGWPTSLLDWDILFLIPLPWWSPVLAPVCISLLLVVGGLLVVAFDRQESPLWPGKPAMIAGGAGCAFVLYSFMANSIRALPNGAEAIRRALPVGFPWQLFFIGLALLALPVLDVIRKIVSRRRRVGSRTG